MLLTTKNLLLNRFNTVVEETTLITKNSQSYNTKVVDINKKIKTINQLQGNQVYWSGLFYDLSSNLKNYITFSYLKVDQTDKSIILRGHSKTRDSLLALKNYFDNNKLYSNINFPVTNLLAKDDIDFEIGATVDLNQLK